MSYAVLQGVMFKATRAARKLPGLAEAALAELVSNDDAYDTARMARLFLQAVISGRALFEGDKGDVCLWSTISNYGSATDLREHLVPFFKRVCEAVAPVPGDVGHPYAPEILVFEAGEQDYGSIDGWALRLNREGVFDVREIKIDFAFNGE